MTRSKIPWALAVPLALACSGDPKMPSIRASFVSYDKVSVTWDASDAAFSNLLVEVTAPFQPFFHASQSVAPGVHAVTIDLPGASDLSELQVRMTGEAGGNRYSSNVVSVKRGDYSSILRCDPDFDCIAGAAGFRLYWWKESPLANRYILTRRIFTLDLAVTGETIIADVRGDGPFEAFDSDIGAWVDGAVYEYALTALHDDLPGQVTRAASVPALLNAPVVVGASTAEGVVLTIGNRSRHAGAIQVFRRTAAAQLSNLVASTSTPENWKEARFVDPDLPPDVYFYQVRVSNSPRLDDPFQSAIVREWVVVSSSEPGTLAASRVDLVPGIFAARAPGGGFAVVTNLLRFGQTPQIGRAVVPDAADGSHALILPDPLTVSRVAVDTDGQPHALYVDVPTPRDDNPIPIVHTWFDGLSWQAEEIGREFTAQDLTAFDIGPEGTLHAAWLGPRRNGALVWVGVATRSSGSWRIDQAINDVPAVGSGQWDGVLLAGDETGAPHLLLWSPLWQIHVFRDQSGWQSESIPEPTPFQYPTALLAGGGRVTLLTDLDYAGSGVRTLAVFERTTSGWSDAIALANNVNFAHAPSAARSADGRRVAIAIADHPYGEQQFGTLWIREADRTTSMYEMFTTPSLVTTGFSADGKAWVLQWLEGGSNWPPGPPAPAVLFEER